MNAKVIGGALLIVGTSIGGGMLALPIATAQSGFLGALLLLFGAWIIMTFGALLILEINLWFPQDSNLISMVRHTLGRGAEIVAWVCYLLLFYCLLAAYIDGGADVFSLILQATHIDISSWLTAVIFVLICGAVVFRGIRSIDLVNRLLMFIKLGSLIILLLFITPHIQFDTLLDYHTDHLASAITLVIASFGFASIVPSLRSYFDDDVNTLRKIILFGSLIPLICYIIWVAAIIGEIPLQGRHGLLSIIHSEQTTAALTQSLIIYLNNSWVGALASTFTSICVITSFLGVSLGLSDFLADGLKKPKQDGNRFVIYAVTFIPPLAVVLINPNLFMLGLRYAGIFCTILLILFPALMAWRGRYHLNLRTSYKVMGNRVILSLAILVSILIIAHELLINFNLL